MKDFPGSWILVLPLPLSGYVRNITVFLGFYSLDYKMSSREGRYIRSLLTLNYVLFEFAHNLRNPNNIAFV